MTRKGENIYKRKDGRWEGRYILFKDPSGKNKFGYIYGKTYKEVKEKLNKEKLKKTSSQSKKKRFSAYCNEWLELNAYKVKASTMAKYSRVVNQYILDYFGNYYPLEIKTINVQRFTTALFEKNLSTKTIKDILVILKSILNYTSQQLSPETLNVSIVYPKEVKNTIHVLTSQQQNIIISYLMEDMDYCKFGVLLALSTGIRIGELCALKWEDISLSKQVIYISKTMQRVSLMDNNAFEKTHIIISEPKSSTSKRIIPLTQKMYQLCQEMMPKEKEAYVLTGKKEQYIEPRLLQYHFSKYMDDCHIENVHFHTLRHTFATRCVEAGFEIKSLSEVLGHSSTKITLDLYVHSSLDLKRENIQKLVNVGL